MERRFAIKRQSMLIEQHRHNPMAVSEGYFKRGLLNLQSGAWLDGLIDLDLAADHLIGELAPRHRLSERFEKNPPDKTIDAIGLVQAAARRQLLRHGPGKQMESRYWGAGLDEEIEETQKKYRTRASDPDESL